MTHLTLHEELYKTRLEQKKIKSERDTLIDDIAVLKANISRLERENDDLKKRNALLMNTVDDLDKENKHLKEHIKHIEVIEYERDKLEKENERLERENEEKTEVIGLYKKAYEKAHKGWFRHRELTDHIRLKAETNPGVSRYIDLVNYIDRLEQK
ncbi:hypothetical protein [Staphylococcus pseudoxylosus]|uniref:hypothetical protein n=1 Tax=Staphylococcus pseudoxylosus TaxID=2282419 RepID=UPI003F575F0E